jgi:predicted amino acid dehydrogenase
MSDEELVKRLRGWDHCWPARWLESAVAEAADRIEALTAKHKELYGVFVFWRAEADKLREQLEAARADTKKAVEALEVIRDRQYYRMGPGITAQVIARAIIAEIKGAKE